MDEEEYAFFTGNHSEDENDNVENKKPLIESGITEIDTKMEIKVEASD
jgi:hypothetical protein